MAQTSQQLNLPYLLTAGLFAVGTTNIPLPTDYDFLLEHITGVNQATAGASARFQLGGNPASLGVNLPPAESGTEISVSTWSGSALLAKGSSLAVVVAGNAVNLTVAGVLCIPSLAEILPS